MRTLGRQARRLLLGISPQETTFARRGFPPAEPAVQRRLEEIGETFVQGYHAALEEHNAEAIVCQLDTVDAERRGWAFEGAAMALALLDCLTPWKRNRLEVFLDGAAQPHIYMVHVGVGWALARLRRRVESPMQRLDPLLRWLVLDGYGFHEGYFRWQRYVKQQEILARLTGYAQRVFDQGLGRSLWFVAGANVARAVETIAAFPAARQADLFSGVGLACAYAGGADRAATEELWVAAGPYQPQLAQGAAFAAKARQRAGNPAVQTQVTCQIFCGLSANAAAAVTDKALDGLPTDRAAPAYEAWRQRIQAQFTAQEVPA